MKEPHLHPLCIYASLFKIKMPPLEREAEPLILVFKKIISLKAKGMGLVGNGGGRHAEYVNLLYGAYLIWGEK